jgi:RNase adaptor protein for sRNA GlmZ degradation
MARGQLEEQRKRLQAEARELERRKELSDNGDGIGVPVQRIVVVGPCASGKTMLANKLRELGYNARSAAQEHSYVPTMWRMSQPSHLIYLDVSMDAIRQRRKVSWGQPYLDDENERLAHAREHADIVIDTDNLTAQEVVNAALQSLEKTSTKEV